MFVSPLTNSQEYACIDKAVIVYIGYSTGQYLDWIISRNPGAMSRIAARVVTLGDLRGLADVMALLTPRTS